MQLSPGILLISAPALTDPNFIKAVILLTDYNQNGATGFVINKPFHRKLNELVEFMHSKPFAIYDGGPVDTENLFILHRKKERIDGSSLIAGDTCIGGNFNQLVNHINKGLVTGNDAKLFIGYCGWDKGELEAEIEEGSWQLAAFNEAFIFSDGKQLWEKLVAK